METEPLIGGHSVSSNWSYLNRKWKILIISLVVLTFVLFLTLIVTASVLTKNLSNNNPDEPNSLCLRGDELIQLTSSSSGLYRANRQQLVSYFPPNGLIYMSGDSILIRNNDVETLFRQNSNFLYVSGVDYPNCSILIRTNDSSSFLFVQDTSTYDAIWYGKIETLDDLKKKFDVDEAFYHSQFANFTSQYSTSTFYISRTLTSIPPSIQNYTLNNTYLDSSLLRSRTLKTPQEVYLLRIVSQISSGAHIRLMEEVVPGLYEYQAESLFLFETYNCFLRHQAYIPIVASGYNGAVLHYSKNNRKMLSGDMLLVDAAGEYLGYSSDITRTFPVNGIFTEEQRVIYQAVLNVQTSIINMLAPGVNWTYISSQTKTLTAQELISAKLVTGSLQDILSNNIVGVFLPHGVGHYVGLDVHDTYSTPSILAPGHVLTIEPGIYFNDALLDAAYKNPNQLQFLNIPLIEKYRNFGGVRIEDVILITSDGHEVFSDAPKEVADIERIMSHR